MKHIKIIFSLLLLVMPYFSCGVCDEKTSQQIKAVAEGGTYKNQEGKTVRAEADPYSLYGYIDSAKVAAFVVDDLIITGLSEAALQQWNKWIACCHDYIRDQLKLNKGVPKIYGSYIGDSKGAPFTIDSITSALERIIADLHSKYQSKTLTVAALDAAKNELAILRKNIDGIMAFGLNTIAGKTSQSPNWKNSVEKDLSAIFPTYTQFFQAFEQAKKQLNIKGAMAPYEVNYYLRNIGIIKSSYSDPKKRAAGEETAATLFYDKLEKFDYRLDDEIKKQQAVVDKLWFKGAEGRKLDELKLMRNVCKEIMDGLHNIYPRTLPMSVMHKLHETQDASSIIIVAEAGALSGVMQALTRNIDEQKVLLKK